MRQRIVPPQFYSVGLRFLVLVVLVRRWPVQPSTLARQECHLFGRCDQMLTARVSPVVLQLLHCFLRPVAAPP